MVHHLQTELSEEDLMRAMSGLGLEEGVEGGDQDMGFMPMMQHMMKSLLSKEVLYPSLKEISGKVSTKVSRTFFLPKVATPDHYFDNVGDQESFL